MNTTPSGTVSSCRAASWTDPAGDQARIAAARQCAAAVAPFASGAYVNTLSDEGADGVRRAYPAHKLARLAAVKDAYDPDNAFHLNHNILPRRQAHQAAAVRKSG